MNVNCVAFGFIRTRLTEPLPAEKGLGAEAANGVYLFCTPESDYISGQVVTVGGGIRF